MTSDIKVVLVKRQTRLDSLIAQYNSESQVRFIIESRGGRFEDYLEEHRIYQAAIEHVQRDLHTVARVHVLDRQYLAKYQFGRHDIIVVVGQDGLVANTLKYLQDQPVIAANPDPDRFDGILLPFKVSGLARRVTAVHAQDFDATSITMAEMSLNDGQTLRAVNDFYIGPRYPISAQYRLKWSDLEEVQSSSGVLVSTGLGSSGWLKSIMTGASGLLDLQAEMASQFAWDSDYLQFVVREPFPSNRTGTSLVQGRVSQDQPLTLESFMPSNGIIFSDGMYEDCVEFNAGAIASFTLAKHRARLVTA